MFSLLDIPIIKHRQVFNFLIKESSKSAYLEAHLKEKRKSKEHDMWERKRDEDKKVRIVVCIFFSLESYCKHTISPQSYGYEDGMKKVNIKNWLQILERCCCFNYASDVCLSIFFSPFCFRDCLDSKIDMKHVCGNPILSSAKKKIFFESQLSTQTSSCCCPYFACASVSA